MATALVTKLTRWAKLPPADRATLDELAVPSEILRRNDILIREGADPKAVFLLLEGWAIRYKHDPDGNRQIVGILVPGDLCDMHICILDRMDHSIAMASPGVIARISTARMLEITSNSAAITRALWWATLVDEAVLREWLVNIGSRSALSRVSHLLCELYIRMQNVERVEANGVAFPLTQQDIADALGLTAIHTNRCLKLLRQKKLVRIEDRRLEILDLAALKDVAHFTLSYLHGRTLVDSD